MNNNPQQVIIDLLEEEHGIARSKLLPSSRLLHDVGVDGDDAAELFQCIHDRYGTDFTALYEQWRIFFNNEGLSFRTFLLGTALIIPSTVLSVAVGMHFNLSEKATGLMAIPMFFGLAWLLRKVCRRREMHPVTIAALAEVVRQGGWPHDRSGLG